MLPIYKTVENQPVVSISASQIEPFAIRCEIPITQSGSGTPTHTNHRPFVGYYKANVKVSPIQSDIGATNYEFQFWATPPESPHGFIGESDYIYGAYFEIDKNGNGTLTQLNRFYILTYGSIGSGNWEYLDAEQGIFYRNFGLGAKNSVKVIGEDEVPPIYCTRFVPVKLSEIDQYDDCITYDPGNGDRRTIIKCSAYANKLSNFRTFLSNNSVRALIEREKPRVTTFDATKVMPLEGQNYVWSDIGNILRLECASYECSDYWDYIRNGNLQHIRVTFPVDGIVFTDDEFASDNVTVTGYMNPDTNLQFGTAYSQEVSLHFMRSIKTDQLNWTREFILEFGVENEDEETEWLKIGRFAGNRPLSNTNNVIDFNAYDRMQRFDKSAIDFLNLLTYPCTLGEIYNKLCAFVGLSVEPGDEIADIMSRTFTEPFDSSGISTLRDLLSKVAEANGCYAKATNDGKIKLVWFQNHTDVFEILRNEIFGIETTNLAQISGQKWAEIAERCTWNDMADFQWSELYDHSTPLLIQGVTAAWKDKELSITQPPNTDSGAKRNWDKFQYTTWYEMREMTWGEAENLGWKGNLCVIEDNPFVYYENEQDIRDHLQEIATRLTDFQMYYVASINAVGNWFVEPGDIVKLETEDGSMANYPIFSRMISWNGSCECDYESTGSITI